MRAMILAAGVGSRLDPLTTQLPKPMVPIAGRPVMAYIIDLLRGSGITEIVSNLHHLPDELKAYFGGGESFGCKLSYHVEDELSGDAGGVRACREYLQGDTFLVVGGDLLTDVDLKPIIKEHKDKKALATIAVKQVKDVSQFGVVLRDENGFITGFQEKPGPDEALSNLASAGIYILEPEIFNHIPETGEYGFGRQLFPKLVEEGFPVLGVQFDAYWSDVGTIRQYRLANFDAVAGRVKVELPGIRGKAGFMGEGASVDPKARIEGTLFLGKNSRIGPDAVIEGTVVVGDNSVIEADAHVADSVIWDGSTIKSGARVVNSVVGRNSVIKNGTTHLESTAVQSVPGQGLTEALA